MRIAQFGTFDVENFGDLLFPLILRRKLEVSELELVPVSPVGGPGVWADGVASISFREFLGQAESFDGLVVGGGNLIHARPTELQAYATGGLTPMLAYADLWLGASVVADRLGIPLCWNAPGVPVDHGAPVSAYTQWALSRVDLRSVRDEASAANLGNPADMRVVVDTGIEAACLWSGEELDRAFEEAFRSRGMTVPERSIAVHVNARYLTESTADTADRIVEIARAFEAMPILLAIGRCHGDGELAVALGRALQVPHLLVDRPASLREVAACVARSRAYFGSSLHGMIAACAFGVRGLVVAPAHLSKFRGFLAQAGLERWMAPGWPEASQMASALRAEPAAAFHGLRERFASVLDAHWGRMRSTLRGDRPVRAASALPDSAVDALLAGDGYRGLPYERPLLIANGLVMLERARRLGAMLEEVREARRSVETKARRQAHKQLELERGRRESERLERELIEVENRLSARRSACLRVADDAGETWMELERSWNRLATGAPDRAELQAARAQLVRLAAEVDRIAGGSAGATTGEELDDPRRGLERARETLEQVEALVRELCVSLDAWNVALARVLRSPAFLMVHSLQTAARSLSRRGAASRPSVFELAMRSRIARESLTA